MKILQIVNPVVPFPANTVGGIERVVQYLMEELLLKGHEITLLAHSDSVVSKDVRFIPIGRYQDQTKAIKIIWQHLLTTKYDVIHNHGRLIYFLPLIWSKVRKIHTFHMAELETTSFLRFTKLNAKNLTLSPCGKWIQEKSSHLKGDWAFVNNGLPKKLYSYKKKTIDPKAPMVIICRMDKNKGVYDAIKLSKITNRRLVIAGKIGDCQHEIDWFKNDILSQCDGNHIKFIGPVNDQQKQELLNIASVLLIPTTDSEAFNTTMLEANACGCPVISYNRFCFNEYIVNGINGFKGDTFQDLVEAISKLNQIERQTCRDFFEDNYTSAIMTANYLKLYQSKI